MDEITDDIAENYEATIKDHKYSEWSCPPRSERLPGRNDVNNKRSFRQQFVVDDEQGSGRGRPQRISLVFSHHTNRKSSFRQMCSNHSDYQGQGLQVKVFKQQRRRETQFIKQRKSTADGDGKGGQNHPKYVPSAFDNHTSGKKSTSSPMHSHYKEPSTQDGMGQLRSYPRRVSRFSSQSFETTESTIATKNASAERFKSSSKRYCYSYQLKHPDERIDDAGRSGDGLRTVESHARYDNVLSPKQQHRNWLAPCRRFTHSSYQSPNKLCSNKNVPTHQQNQDNQSRKLSRNLAPKIHGERFQKKGAPRPPFVPQRLQHSPREKVPYFTVPEANNLQGTRSPKQIQISNITSQFQEGCFLPPIEIVTDYSCRATPEERSQARSKKSSNERLASTMEEEILQNAEYTYLLQQRPKQSAVEKTCRSQDGGEKQACPSNPSSLILEDPFPPLIQNHNDQFPDDIRGPRLSRRRNAVCNELEKETSRVKINGFRMSLHDMRVDLGELTKRSRIRESVLGNSEVQTGATEEDNTFLEEYLNSQRSDRRKAICQEIEKTMNTFKVNGLRMSLCHMRAELGGLNEHRLSDERLEEELNKPRGLALNSNGFQSWKQKRRRTTTAIRKFISDFSN
ncbi:hypothetical protein ACROYT_G043655 [Oculina patagonica]